MSIARCCSRSCVISRDLACPPTARATAGECYCKHGWNGTACDEPTCPRGLGEHAAPCAGHGRCVRGLCACDGQWVGVACDVYWKGAPPPPPPPRPPATPPPSLDDAPWRAVAAEFVPVVAPSRAAAARHALRHGRRAAVKLLGELQPLLPPEVADAGAAPVPAPAQRVDQRRVPPPVDMPISTESLSSVGDAGLGLPGPPLMHQQMHRVGPVDLRSSEPG